MSKRLASGKEFAAVMEEYNLRTNEGQKLVATILNFTQSNVRNFYVRGLRRNDLEMLKIKLAAMFKGPVLYTYDKNTGYSITETSTAVEIRGID